MGQHSAISSSQLIDEEADHLRDSGEWNKAVGIRFRPTPGALIYYLAGKAGNKVYGGTDGPIFPLIKYVVDLYEREPSELKSEAYDFGDGYMYFFTHIQKKYQKGSNFNRETKGGCWVPGRFTDAVKDDKPVAIERSLTYFRNDLESRKPTEKTQPSDKPREKFRRKTQWLMKEYVLLEEQNDNDPEDKTLALCVVYFHDKKRKQRDNENDQSSQPDVEEPKGSASSAIHPPLIHSSSNHEAAILKQELPPYPYHVEISGHPNVFNPSPNCNPSNPAAPSFEQALLSPCFFPNMQSTMNGSWVHTVDQNSNVFTPTPNPPYPTTNPAAAFTFEQALLFSPNSESPNTPNIINESWNPIATAPNHNLPSYESCSNPAASPLELLFSNPYENMPGNPADSSVYILNHYPSTSSPLDFGEFLDQPLIMNQNQDPSGLTSAESSLSWCHAPNEAF